MKLPYISLYPGDWLRDQVAGCSLAAQGLWLRMMYVMHDSDRYGYLSINGVPIPPEHVASRCGVTLEQYTTLLAELDKVGVPRRANDGTIYSKRMVDDAKKRATLSESRAKAGAKGGKQKASKGGSKTVAKLKQTPEDENEDDIDREQTDAEKIYELYPLKVGKAAALKAIEKALEAKPFGELRAATYAYQTAVALWPETDRQYVPHPATWFNQARYDDDRATWTRRGSATGPPKPPAVSPEVQQQIDARKRQAAQEAEARNKRRFSDILPGTIGEAL